MSRAYYNEIDPYAAQWLRNLIDAGLIAPGVVDERSIEDVLPIDLLGYTQCHFFAGVGVWSYALRLAGWPDDRPIWTGSCPCQPFSSAGQGEGFDDERHLWPAWYHLILHGKRPGVPVFGEQVANGDGLKWLDLVHADLEGAGYTLRPFDLCAAGFGTPHIRQRLFFYATDGVAQGNAIGAGFQGFAGHEPGGDEPGRIGAGSTGSVAAASDPCSVANPGHGEHIGRDTLRGAAAEHDAAEGTHGGRGEGGYNQAWIRPGDDAAVRSAGDGVADTNCEQCNGTWLGRKGRRFEDSNRRPGDDQRPGPTNGLWGPADWLFCRDGKWRPVEPGTQPLVDGVAIELGRSKSSLGGMARGNRTHRLKGYGNAINAEVAAAFIRGVMPDLIHEQQRA